MKERKKPVRHATQFGLRLGPNNAVRACDGQPATPRAFDEYAFDNLLHNKGRVRPPTCPDCAVLLDQAIALALNPPTHVSKSVKDGPRDMQWSTIQACTGEDIVYARVGLRQLPRDPEHYKLIGTRELELAQSGQGVAAPTCPKCLEFWKAALGRPR